MKRDIDLIRQLLLDIENRGADCSVSVLRSSSTNDPSHHGDERIRYHLRLLIDAGMLREVDRTAAGVPCVRLTHDGHEMIELVRSESRWREAKWVCQQQSAGLSLHVLRGILYRWAVSASRRGFPHPTYGRRRRGYLPVGSYPVVASHVDERVVYPRAGYAVDPYRAEPYRPQPYRAEPYRIQPARPEAYRADAYRAELYRMEPYHVEPYHVEPYHVEPYRLGAYRYESRDAWFDDDARFTRPRPEFYDLGPDEERAHAARVDGDGLVDVGDGVVLPDYLV